MKVIRVFTERTSFTPKDDYVFIGDPPMFRPPADKVHISCSFTWDRQRVLELKESWGRYYDLVQSGGPAFGDRANGFMPGMYVNWDVTFTSRGCNSNCPWCLVPEIEGKLSLIDNPYPAPIVQDNNLLQTGISHLDKVFYMLRRLNKSIDFRGGLDTSLLTDWVAEELRSVKIQRVFLAADTEGSLKLLERARQKLWFLPRDKVYCYALLAYKGETIDSAKDRLLRIWQLNCLPFAQLYQPPEDKKIEYSKEWRDLARTWSRPAAMKALNKVGV